MPLPSYTELKRQNALLMQQVSQLKHDQNYGVLTRAGIPIELRSIKRQARWVVFLDIDDCREANKQWGYEGVNKKIKRSMGLRHADILLRARWYSGDELIVILKGDAEGFMQRLRVSFRNNGLSATMAAVPFTGDLEGDVRLAATIVQARKEGGEA